MVGRHGATQKPVAGALCFCSNVLKSQADYDYEGHHSRFTVYRPPNLQDTWNVESDHLQVS